GVVDGRCAGGVRGGDQEEAKAPADEAAGRQIQCLQQDHTFGGRQSLKHSEPVMEMNWGTLIEENGRGPNGARDLDEEDAWRMFAAMLDGAVPELELGGIMIALRIKGESVAELRGFQRAAAERMQRLVAPAGAPRPVVLPSYNGARRQPNLLPLLALLLTRAGC